MTDRELLELAAKAAGIEWYGYCGDDKTEVHYFDIGPDEVVKWNPLTNDGDAFRLAVELCISIRYLRRPGVVIAGSAVGIGYADDRAAATRRSIVRAAAKRYKEPR